MSLFTNFDTSLKLEYLLELSKRKEKDHWRVIDGFVYYSDVIVPNERVWVEVPNNFMTDGASVPRFIWNWIPPLGVYGQAAVLHDYLRDCGLVRKYKGQEATYFQVNTKQADVAFLEAMTVLGVPKLKRYTMYYAVRFWSLLKGLK